MTLDKKHAKPPPFFLHRQDDIRYVIEASRPYLEGKPDATVAYLPLASLFAERWQEFTADSFKGLARVETVNAELMTLPQMEDVIRRAALVYIPVETPSCSIIACTSAG